MLPIRPERAKRSEFVYDGLQRRVRQIEKDNGVTTDRNELIPRIPLQCS